MNAMTFARGAAPKAGKAGKGNQGGIVSAIVGAVTGDGGCGNGTVSGKRGFQPGNKCHGNRNQAVTAKQKAHTAANAVTRKHLKAGTLNTPAGHAAVRTAAAAARELKAARDTHKAEQKVRYAAAARDRRVAAKAAASTPAARAAATLKAAREATNPGKPAAAPKPAPTPKSAPKTAPAEHVAKGSKEASDVKASRAAAHLSGLHAGVKAGSLDEKAAHGHVDKLARGYTKDELFAAAKSAGVEHSAKTKKALVEHLKGHLAAPKAGATPGHELPLKDFADRAVRGAHAAPAGGFGEEKTFISHAHEHLRKTDPAFKDVTLAQFKGRLVEAHRARHLELGRADLVEAMHPADVKASGTKHGLADYHFIRHPEAKGKAQSRRKEGRS